MLDRPSQVVLVTGATGQDGSYLSERLVGEGHEIHAMVRSEAAAERLVQHHPGLVAHIGDLTDSAAMERVVRDTAPDVVYNLAGSTSVAWSWSDPVGAADVMAVGAVRLLEASWRFQQSSGRTVRFLQASSAEIFGNPVQVPQDESTPLDPITPYGAAKTFAHHMVRVYRRRGMYAINAVLYNHESPRRPETFVARKISRGVARIALGLADELVLGNIDVKRDWGFAGDYVDGMITALSAAEPDDYVVATGEAHSVRQLVVAAFAHIGVEHWHDRVRIDSHLYRPADPLVLVGDASRLRGLGWEPKMSFTDLVATMVDADLAELSSGVGGPDAVEAIR